MSNILRSIPVLLAALLGMATQAQTHEHAHSAHGQASPAPASAAPLTDGEITRVDARSGRLTVRHGDIPNLDMPAMTMVFALPDPQQATQFKPGDKIRFRAEQPGGVLTLTHVERAG